MAFDATVIRAITQELNTLLSGGKIDKIHQPERGTLTMTVRTKDGGYRLLLSANPSCARVHLMSNNMENPTSPPMFCMLMRKHLSGSKITLIEQPEFERIIKIHTEGYDEMGYLSEKVLICEIMGKYSNIILTNKDQKIIDAIYHVDMSISSVRLVLPGLIYTAPPAQDKQNPLNMSKSEIKKLIFKTDVPLANQIMNGFSGISPLVAREIAYLATGATDTLGINATDEQIDKTGYILYTIMQNVINHEFFPCIVKDSQSGKLIDFNAIDIKQYELLAEVEHYKTANEAAEMFFIKKSSAQSLKQKSGDLLKFINNNLDRCRKKLQIENETIEKANKREKFKIYGDLITANIYRISQGMKSIECENFYSENGETIKIPLKDDLTPSQNAQRYYQRYNKEKTALCETQKQKDLNLTEIEYLESVKQEIEVAESGAEISMIREELTEQGYLKQHGKPKKSKKSTVTPMHFVSDDGYDIYAGKNNMQNDYVTFKLSRSTDIWFHTKGVHGSHTLIKTSDAMQVPDRTYLQAASIAAYYSKARSSQNVEVDYTEVKNVKKPAKAKPGMVIYVDYNTIVATPDEELAKRLKK